MPASAGMPSGLLKKRVPSAHAQGSIISLFGLVFVGISCCGLGNTKHSPLLLLWPFIRPLGLVFYHGKLDFALHVVNPVNQHTNFVADGIGLPAAAADDLPRVFMVRVVIV